MQVIFLLVLFLTIGFWFNDRNDEIKRKEDKWNRFKEDK